MAETHTHIHTHTHIQTHTHTHTHEHTHTHKHTHTEPMGLLIVKLSPAMFALKINAFSEANISLTV